MNMQQTLIMGRSTGAGKIIQTKEGKDFGIFSVAVNTYGPDRESTKYYSIEVFNKTLEKVKEIKKGDLVMVDGEARSRGWLSNEGEVKTELVIKANRFKLLK
jgi:single-stranded DNA-binding protein